MSGEERLQEHWKNCGIERGDLILFHSDTLKTLIWLKKMGFEPSVQTILEALKQMVGVDGTLLFPLFNFDFTKGVPFDIRVTPSHMGALTEAARQTPGAVRTGHPVYSFAVIGKRAEEFKAIDNLSGYGADGPFGLLTKFGGKISVLGLDEQSSMTFYHHIEEIYKVNYRYLKYFTGDYIDEYGNCSTRRYSIYVRDLKRGVVTHLNPAGDLLWSAGLYKGDRHDQGTFLRTIDAKKMFDFVGRLIDSGKAKGHLYLEEEV